MIPLDKVVEVYISTRNQIKEMEDELAEKLKPLKALQDTRERYLHQRLTEMGAQNTKTAFGTVYQTRKESVTVSDWAILLDHIKKENRYDLLNRAVNKTVALEIMGDERQNQPPPGVSYSSVATVNIRKN